MSQSIASNKPEWSPVKLWGVDEANHRVLYGGFIGHFLPGQDTADEVYNSDPKWLIRCKGIGILCVFNPIFSVARVVYYVAKTAFQLFIWHPFSLCFRKAILAECGKELYHTMEMVVRSVIYGLLMELSAGIIILSPYDGRKIYATFARQLAEQQYGFRFRQKDEEDWFLYEAPCMQPIRIVAYRQLQPKEGIRLETIKATASRLESSPIPPAYPIPSGKEKLGQGGLETEGLPVLLRTCLKSSIG